jgi:hypothetical protein
MTICLYSASVQFRPTIIETLKNHAKGQAKLFTKQRLEL